MSEKQSHETIIILDFGSQYTQLIARRIRESGVFCEVLPYNTPLREIEKRELRGVILSGGPSSVYDEGSPRVPIDLLVKIKCPILGICYGLQLLAAQLGGEVLPSKNREYGYARLELNILDSPLFAGLPQEMDVWMSHGDNVVAPPQGFRIISKTDKALNALEDLSK